VIPLLETRSILHQAAKQAGLGHKVFARPLVTGTTSNNNSNNNVIEQALDEILYEIGDDTKYVEYWTRQEWRSIEAHADVDEFLAKQQQQQQDGTAGGEAPPSFRYPDHGHVLYLQVGTNVRGPTCVFPDRKSGGDLLRPTTTTENNDDGLSNHNHNHDVPLVTVPAVPGRVLRFDGSYLHAVPRPADLWLLKFTRGAPSYRPEEEWGRSVILFNTWGDKPPQDVPLDDDDDDDDGVTPPTTTTPQQSTTTEVAGGNEKHYYYSCAEREKWTQSFSFDAEQQNKTCSTPTPITITTQEEEKPLSAKVWLLGNEKRRDYVMRTVTLAAPESLRHWLSEESRVGHTILERPRSGRQQQ
jgi:hypothetical protein